MRADQESGLCIVCELYPILQNRLGRGGSRTCGVSCSQLRNSVGTDEEAREKWLRINVTRTAYRRFCLGYPKEGESE